MGISWLKTGADSIAIAKADEAEKALAVEQRNTIWRFGLKVKEEAKITFVDGDLTAEGYLAPPRYYEHSIYKESDNKVYHFVCPEKTVPDAGHKCPLCAAGDKASLVALFTVIDHRPFTSKAGKVFPVQKRLFVAKSQTMEMISIIAMKRHGLAGAMFDVIRSTKTDPAVGSMFDFIEKNPIQTLQSMFTDEVETNGVKKVVTLFTPADYATEIVFRTPEEMLKANVLALLGGGGSYHAPATTPAAGPVADYSKEL